MMLQRLPVNKLRWRARQGKSQPVKCMVSCYAAANKNSRNALFPFLFSGTLQSLYGKAMTLEAAFFSAQPYQPPARIVKQLIVDFDETCTEKDTIGRLMQLSSKAFAKVGLGV